MDAGLVGIIMLITTRNGTSFDTETDLKAPERHIVQKLIIWEALAHSLEEFRQKKTEALHKGWNESGPIREGEVLKAITADMEEKVLIRLKKA
jgi:hypothetical protein